MLMTEPRAADRARRFAEKRKLADHGCRIEFPKPRKSALQKIKVEALRLAGNGSRTGFQFAQRLFAALPELRDV
jgi:hypothetical protein